MNTPNVIDQQTYDELVFRISNRTFRMDDASSTPEFRDHVNRVLDAQKGFMCLHNDGSVEVLDPVATLCNKLTAYGKYLGYFMKPDGRVAAFQLPMKEATKNRHDCICVDNQRVNEALEKAGVKTKKKPALYKLDKGHVHISISDVTEELRHDWLKDAMAIYYKPKIRLMDELFGERLPYGLSTADESDAESCASTMPFGGCGFDIQKVLSGNALHDIVRDYNTNVIMRHILGERVTGFPKNSDAVRLAVTFVPYIPQKKNAEWENSNVTKSIREESLDKSDAMRAITSIKRPSFERMPGNKNDRTFDQIRIRLGIVGKDTMPNRNEQLKRNQRTLARIALAKIRDTKSFQRYGIPMNFLRLDHMTITCQDELELVFVLKDISQKEE